MATEMAQAPTALRDPLALPLARSEEARLQLVQGLKRFNSRQSLPAVTRRFERKGTLDDDLLYRFHQHIAFQSQRIMWNTIEDACEKHADFIEDALKDPINLKLDSGLPLPDYFFEEVHCRPGGHYVDAPHQGWYTDLANYVYFAGDQNNRETKYAGANAIPAGDYRRIVELGCGIGQATWPLCERWPEAEVYAVDLSAGLLRYAAKRAQAMGLTIHFSQQNAERTNFADGSFDLVYANILFHEIPTAAAKNVVLEAYRLLAPGGRFVIADVAPFRRLSPVGAYISSWQTENNGETFWQEFCETDLPALFKTAGFVDVEDYTPAPPNARPHPWITTGIRR